MPNWFKLNKFRYKTNNKGLKEDAADEDDEKDPENIGFIKVNTKSSYWNVSNQSAG